MVQVRPQGDLPGDMASPNAASGAPYLEGRQLEAMVSEDALETAMNRLFTQLEGLDRNFTDREIEDIKDLLSKAGKKAWSVRPRTYAVLRMINKVELMDSFVQQELFDIMFPYRSLTIPLIVKSPGLRRKFLQKQALVLTDAKDMEGGSHAHLASDAGVHFDTIKLLGRGGFGDVDRIRSNLSLKDYARKRILRRKKFDGSEANEAAFRNEVEHLKRFSHQHLVKYIGSYTDPRYFGLLMLPVADCDLRAYLARSPFPENDLSHLRQFYGCITSAVAYLHRNACRHKDLKPGNILVKRGEVYVTDFGLALDWSEATKSVTVGPPGAISIDYAAPEVMKEEPRGSSSDMWSVGCIFLDIATVLKGDTLEGKRAFFEKTGSFGRNPRDNPKAFELWMEHLDSRHDKHPCSWTKELIVSEPDDRTTAEALLDKIRMCNDSEDGFIYYCIQCDESDDAVAENPHLSGKVVSEEDYEDESNEIKIGTEDISAVQEGLCHAVSRADQSDARLWLRKWERLRVKLEDGSGSARIESKALHIAARQGLERIAADLLKYGFDADAKLMGSTPLHLAVENSHEGVMRLLVDQDADLTIKNDSFGHTVLHIAAIKGNASAIQYLLDKGLDVNVLDKADATALHWAALNAQSEIVALLLRQPHLDILRRNQAGHPAFHLAAAAGHADIVKLMIDAGMQINTPDRDGNTALHLAAAHGHIFVVRLLAQHGPEVNTPSTSGYHVTPLHLAAASGFKDIVREILAVGVNPDVVDVEARTALHVAVSSGHTEVASLLLQGGFDVDKKSKGATCLGVALRMHNMKMAQLLVDHHANINMKDPDGSTYLHFAAAMSDKQVLSFLLSNNANIETRNHNRQTPLVFAITTGKVDAAQLLIDKGADVQAEGVSKETALHHAVYKDNIAIVEILLKHGARVNAQSTNFVTPLHLAALQGRVPIAQVLLKHGADPFLRDMDKNCPIDLAKAGGFKKMEELLSGFKEDRKIFTKLRSKFGKRPH